MYRKIRDSIMGKAIKESLQMSYVSADTTVDGQIEIRDIVKIDGKVIGKVVGETSTAVIGETAVVEGEVMVGIAIVNGVVNGTIQAKTKAEFYPPARISGDIKSAVIAIEAGVVINDVCIDCPKILIAGEISDLS